MTPAKKGTPARKAGKPMSDERLFRQIVSAFRRGVLKHGTPFEGLQYVARLVRKLAREGKL